MPRDGHRSGGADPRRQPRRDQRHARRWSNDCCGELPHRRSSSFSPPPRPATPAPSSSTAQRPTTSRSSVTRSTSAGAIPRVLDGLRPSVVVLMELEVWPNFSCTASGATSLCAGERPAHRPELSQLSAGRSRSRRRMLRRLAAICVQDEAYAERFIELGVRRTRRSHRHDEVRHGAGWQTGGG